MARPLFRPALGAALAVALVPTGGHGAPPNAPPPPPPVLVPPPPPAAPASIDPAYDGVIAAMLEAVDQEAAYDGIAASIAREYASVPEIARLEAIKPGLIKAIVAGLRPVMLSYGNRVRSDYRPKMAALLARYFTPDEARDVAAFYRSPVGRKLMGNVSRSITADATVSGIGSAISEGKEPGDIKVGSDQIAADAAKATGAALGQLTQDDLKALDRMAREKPALLKLNLVAAELLPLRTAMENEPPTADEIAQIQEAVVTAMTRHMDN
jgi:hypothetical protein